MTLLQFCLKKGFLWQQHMLIVWLAKLKNQKADVSPCAIGKISIQTNVYADGSSPDGN